MTDVTTTRSRGYVDRPTSSSLADVIDIILDKGLVIDVFVRVSLVGIEVVTIDARIVVASVDTYLRFAEATNRLDLEQTGGRDLPELVEDISEGGSSGKTKGMLQGAKEALVGSDDDRSKSGSGSRSRSEDENDEDRDEAHGKEENRRTARREPPERPRRRTATRSRRER
ncbi:gas vesicle protein GvpJ [Promicromonospora vindobonensis]